MKENKLITLFIGVSAALGASTAMAASGMTGSADFSHAKDTASGWLVGDLGIAIATAGGIWGMIAAVAGNIKMAGLGVGIAAVAALSAPVISSIFGATI